MEVNPSKLRALKITEKGKDESQTARIRMIKNYK